MKKIYILQFIIIMTVLGNVQAQSGPVSPCVDCEQFTKRVEPATGTWYNPEQSGTGFGIEVQKGKLFGTYYGYDAQGKQLWLTFVGDLQESNQAGVMWELQADLQQFENGSCFGCIYQQPNTTDYSGTISIKFTQMNHAVYSVNGSEEQNIVPVIYGVPTSVDFPEQTIYRFPELEGFWVFVYQLDTSASQLPYPYNSYSVLFRIGRKGIRDSNNDGYEEISYTIFGYPFAMLPEVYVIGQITCSVENVNNEITGPFCKFYDQNGIIAGPPDYITYKMSIGGIGAFRLFGESPEGHTFQAFKVDSKKYPCGTDIGCNDE